MPSNRVRGPELIRTDYTVRLHTANNQVIFEQPEVLRFRNAENGRHAYLFSRLIRPHATEVRSPNRMREVEGSGTAAKKTLGWRLVRSVFLMMMSERRVLRKESISARVKSGSRSYQK